MTKKSDIVKMDDKELMFGFKPKGKEEKKPVKKTVKKTTKKK